MAKKRCHSRLRGNRESRLVRMYPVYACRSQVNQFDVVLGESPIMMVNKVTRDVWLEQGAVISISRGKAVRLLLNLPPRPQRSVTMGPSVLEGVVERQAYALGCQAAWRPTMVASQVSL